MIQILVMNCIILVLAIALTIAQRLLVTYGKCKIVLNYEGRRTEFTVEGGDYLINYLNKHDIYVPSSCGGKAICGYCRVKVLKGGGPILPTEDPFLSREDKLSNVRLACQIKVKSDIEIYIPDYLMTVVEIVKDRKFDPSKRWRFIIE